MKQILLAIAMLCPVATWAQDIKPIDAKPGLWENTTTSQISGVAMPAMPQLTPDQLARMPPADARPDGSHDEGRRHGSSAHQHHESLHHPRAAG